MSIKSAILMVVVSTSVATVAGAAAGYMAAVMTPVSSNVAVLDVDALAKTIDPHGPDYLAKANALSERTKEVTQKLTAQGMVVLDRAQVIAAPEEAIVYVGTAGQ